MNAATPDPEQSTEHLVVFSRVASGQNFTLICGFNDADRKSVVLQGGS